MCSAVLQANLILLTDVGSLQCGSLLPIIMGKDLAISSKAKLGSVTLPSFPVLPPYHLLFPSCSHVVGVTPLHCMHPFHSLDSLDSLEFLGY